MTTTTTMILLLVGDWVAKEREDMNKWIKRAQENPVDALYWGDTAFDTAAELFVAETFLSYLTHKDSKLNRDWFAMIRKEMTREFFRRSEKIGGSTNASHNLMDRAIVERLAKFLNPQGWTNSLESYEERFVRQKTAA